MPTKKDCPTTDEQIKETKNRFGYLHYRSIIGALFYVSCYTRPHIYFAVNKLAKFANNPGEIHFRALLHLLAFLQNSRNKGLRFYFNIKSSPTNFGILFIPYMNSKLNAVGIRHFISNKITADCPYISFCLFPLFGFGVRK